MGGDNIMVPYKKKYKAGRSPPSATDKPNPFQWTPPLKNNTKVRNSPEVHKQYFNYLLTYGKDRITYDSRGTTEQL